MKHKRDAVDYWDNEDIHHEAKSPEVRKWMLDSNNYQLEKGGGLGETALGARKADNGIKI